MTGRIDVHHHPVSPGLLAEIRERAPGQHALIDWSISRSLEDLERAGVAKAYLSVPPPGVWFGDARAARRLARETNEYAARLVREHPGRFGLLAALPLPDVEGSLAELAYALDVLKADGVGLMTNAGGKWLGEPAYAPLMQELNRRRVVVYTHPVAAPCCTGLMPAVPDHLVELATDTTRAIANLMLSGDLAAYRDIRFIFSHAGGTLPYIVERFTWYFGVRPELARLMPGGPVEELRRLYYDTANSANQYALPCLLKLVSLSQVVLGSDFPFRTCEEHVRGLRTLGFGEAELRAIETENAQRLFA